MTPEERQRTMDFILASHANAMIRMDRFEENAKRHDGRIRRHDEDLAQIWAQLHRQRETVDGLLRVTQDLLAASHLMIDRFKRLEGRTDSVDETLKVLRELLEANLRRPDSPSS